MLMAFLSVDMSPLSVLPAVITAGALLVGERGRPARAKHVPTKFGAWIKAQRLSRGWSSERMSEELGLSQGAVSLYERGSRHPKREMAVEIARALGEDPREALSALMLDTPGLDSETLTGQFGTLSPETIEAVQVLGLFPVCEREAIIQYLRKQAELRGLLTDV